MKNKILLILMFVSVVIKAQITLEHSYPATSNNNQLFMVKLNAGYKYQQLDPTNGTVKLYNLDHSLYKNISLMIPSGYTYLTISNLSDGLFDMDNNVEVCVSSYTYNSLVSPITFSYVTKIIKDNGTVVLNIPQCRYAYAYNTEANGWKLIATMDSLNKSTNEKFDVYSLVGSMPLATNIKNNDSETSTELLNPFPNPSNNHTTIPYELPLNVTTAQLVIYDMNGKALKTFTIDHSFNTLELDNSEFPTGTYLYNISSQNWLSDSKKIIVVK
jgi:hypothetical protein